MQVSLLLLSAAVLGVASAELTAQEKEAFVKLENLSENLDTLDEVLAAGRGAIAVSTDAEEKAALEKAVEMMAQLPWAGGSCDESAGKLLNDLGDIILNEELPSLINFIGEFSGLHWDKCSEEYDF